MDIGSTAQIGPAMAGSDVHLPSYFALWERHYQLFFVFFFFGAPGSCQSSNVVHGVRLEAGSEVAFISTMQLVPVSPREVSVRSYHPCAGCLLVELEISEMDSHSWLPDFPHSCLAGLPNAQPIRHSLLSF